MICKSFLNADTSSQDVDWADSLSDIQDMTEDVDPESKEREDESEEPEDETSDRGEFVRILECCNILYKVLSSFVTHSRFPVPLF